MEVGTVQFQAHKIASDSGDVVYIDTAIPPQIIELQPNQIASSEPMYVRTLLSDRAFNHIDSVKGIVIETNNSLEYVVLEDVADSGIPFEKALKLAALSKETVTHGPSKITNIMMGKFANAKH